MRNFLGETSKIFNLFYNKIMEKDKSKIPVGLYCYKIKKIKEFSIEIDCCPYWDINLTKPDQENGYCHYLGYGDWEAEHLSLLWDQVKECGINELEKEY